MWLHPAWLFNFLTSLNKGVGLAREEFIINNYIQVHPLALLNHRSLNDKELSLEIEKKINGLDAGRRPRYTGLELSLAVWPSADASTR